MLHMRSDKNILAQIEDASGCSAAPPLPLPCTLSLYCYPSLSCYTSFPLLCPSLPLSSAPPPALLRFINHVRNLFGQPRAISPKWKLPRSIGTAPAPLPTSLSLSLFALLSFLFLAASGTVAVHLHILNAFGRKIVTGERCAISALPRPAISAHQSALSLSLPLCLSVTHLQSRLSFLLVKSGPNSPFNLSASLISNATESTSNWSNKHLSSTCSGMLGERRGQWQEQELDHL